jgi:hypothetical protein
MARLPSPPRHPGTDAISTDDFAPLAPAEHFGFDHMAGTRNMRGSIANLAVTGL